MTHFRRFFYLICSLVLISPLTAQTTSYFESFEDTDSNPGGINTTTDDDNSGWASVLAGGLNANAWSAAQAIPFTFEFFGTPVTQYKVSANGLITFDAAATALPSVNGNLPDPALPDNTIACFWDEFTNVPPTGGNDEVYVRVFGSAGSQQLWIKWFSFEYGNPSGNSFNYMACVLEEGTNNVYLVDMGNSANAANMTTTVGLQKDATTAIQFGTNTLTFNQPSSSNVSNNTFYQFTPYLQFNQDVALLSIDAPSGPGCYDANTPVTLTLRNIGATAATGVTASFSVDGGAFTTPETIPGSIASGDSLTYTLTTLADLSGGGTHTVDATLSLAGDGNTSNDDATASSSTQAQVIAPYSENFDAGTPADWLNDPDDEGEDWRNSVDGTAAFGPPSDHTSGTGEYMWVDDSSPHSDLTNFISPCIDLSALSFPTMDFWVWSENQGPSLDMILHVDIEANGLWSNDVIAPISDLGAAWNRIIVNLTPYVGQTIRVRFRMEEPGSGFEHDIAIDDFSVFENVGNDIALLSLVTPAGDDCGLDQEMVSIEIVNIGANAAAGITASFAVDNGAPIPAETIPTTINPNDTLIYTFTALADLAGLGLHTLDVFVNLAGDADASNDSLFTNISNLTGVTAPYAENFDNGFPADWFNDINDTGEDWINSANGIAGFGAGNTDHTSGTGEYMWVDDSGPHGSETNLITPCIDISAMVAPEMEFWVWSENSDLTRDDMILHVDIGVGGVFTNDVITPIGHIGAGWNLVPIDLAPFAGSIIKVRFRIEEQDTGFQHDISIDDFRVFENLDNDVQVVSIDAPVGNNCGFTANEAVTIQIANNGNNAASGISARFSVNGALSALETVPGTLASGDTITYTFGATANLLNPAVYEIVGIATTGADQNVVNDSLTTTVETLLPSAPPVSEDFDLYLNGATAFDEMSNNPAASVPFEVNFGATPTGNTGPDDDASGGGGYIFLESSGTNSGDQGIVCFDCIDLSGATAPNLVFSYHLYGSSVGSLSVDIDNGGVITNELLLTGEQQTTNSDPWIQDTINLAPYVGSVIQICFTGTILADGGGATFNGDMALDEITVREFAATDVAALDVQLPDASCALGNETVTIEVQNQGVASVSTIIATYSINGGPFSAPEIIPGSIQPGASTNFSFTNLADLSATGAYTITAAVSVNGDGNSFNDTIVGTTENLPLVDTYPYFEDFESGAGGWSATGTLPSWAFGTPAKAVISGAGSGANAWVTGGLGQGTYNANEASAVEGPCFDFTTLPAGAAVGLKVWWEAESSFDGAALQVSTDGGTSWSTIGAFNDPINWYNDTLINSAPGGSIEGWTGSSASGDGSGGYVQAQHPLDPALAGQADVRFRVAFGSDGSTEYDGFAFDDIAIGVPPAIDLGSDSIITCGGDILNPGAGFASYLWSNGATTQTVSLINLTGQPIVDSVITVIVTDNAGLIATDTVVVTISGEAPEVSASVNNDVSCFGEDDGIAFAQGTGGTGNLTYEWNTNPPQNTQVATGLTAGTYVITVSDQGGCVVTDSVTIVEPAELTVEINAQVNVDCAGDTDGSLDVNIVGGEAPYSIEWNTGDTTTVLTGLGAGTYDATITDAGGCENTVSVDIIAENEAPVASFSASSAGTTVTFTNTSVGTGAYAWDFGDGAGVSSDESPVYTYASTGAYSVLLIVSNACGTSSTRDSVFVGVMSRQDLLNSELSLYPNPTTGLVELQVAGMNLNEVEVHLFTLQGQEVHVESIGYLPAGATHRLTLSDALSEGMYLLQLRSREGLLHKRLTLKR